MFVYCGNNPVIRYDPLGCFFLQTAFEFLDNWLNGNSEDMHYSDGSNIVKALRRSSKMQKLIFKAFDVYQETGKNYFEGENEFTPKEDGYDLYLAVQKFSYSISLTEETRTTGIWFWRRKEKRYVVNVIVHDTYNFDELRKWNSFGNFMNNVAVLYDVFLGGHDFYWSANYTVFGRWFCE